MTKFILSTRVFWAFNQQCKLVRGLNIAKFYGLVSFKLLALNCFFITEVPSLPPPFLPSSHPSSLPPLPFPLSSIAIAMCRCTTQWCKFGSCMFGRSGYSPAKHDGEVQLQEEFGDHSANFHRTCKILLLKSCTFQCNLRITPTSGNVYFLC